MALAAIAQLGPFAFVDVGITRGLTLAKKGIRQRDTLLHNRAAHYFAEINKLGSVVRYGSVNE